MKLLLYSHYFAPSVGGVETFTMDLAGNLAKSSQPEPVDDFQVVVVTQTQGGNSSDDAALPFKIVRRPGILELWRLVGEAKKVLLSGPAILPLLFSLLRFKPVVVTHHGYQAICPNGMLLHLPSGASCSGYFSAGRYQECIKCNLRHGSLPESFRSLMLTFVRRVLCHFASRNVAVSEHVARRIALPKSDVVRNGVPAGHGELPVTGGEYRAGSFAYVGRLVTEKGLPVLIEAARDLKQRGRQFEILIIGDGPEREDLQQQVVSRHLEREVLFLGFQKGQQLSDFTQRVSAFIIPSIYEDAAPLTILDQMMNGRLVIGSRIGGVAEEIGDAGLTFAPGNAAELADRMEQVLEHPELAVVLGQRARERALSCYTLERQIQEYREVLREV